jgi:hypothetical protein
LDDDVANRHVQAPLPSRFYGVTILFAALDETVEIANTLGWVEIDEAQVDFVTGNVTSVV